MKIKILVISLLFLFITTSFGQSDSTVWKRISPQAEEFSVILPESDFFEYKDDSEGKLIWARYTAKLNSNWFYVFSGEETEQTPKDLLSFFASKNNAKPKKIEIDGFIGEKYSFLDSEGFYQQFLTIKSSNRYYVFHLIGFAQNDEIAKRFFESLKIGLPNSAQLAVIQPPESNETPPEKAEKTINNPEKVKKLPSPIEKYDLDLEKYSGGGMGSGRGTGRGSGSGDGVGDGKGVVKSQPPKPKPIDSPIKFFAKPKPRYTELARYYSLTGSVRLRVTFLANGKVGSITPITRLPLGLTNSAITAARQLQFQPPVRNGKPYAVSKRLQYNFTIY